MPTSRNQGGQNRGRTDAIEQDAWSTEGWMEKQGQNHVMSIRYPQDFISWKQWKTIDGWCPPWSSQNARQTESPLWLSIRHKLGREANGCKETI